MYKHFKDVSHQGQGRAEAGPTPAALPREEPLTTTPGDSRNATYPPDITWDREAVENVLDNSKWRKAYLIDDELRWAKADGDGIGEKVEDHAWKVRHYGKVVYLAPNE